jgi:hypothetical protein
MNCLRGFGGLLLLVGLVAAARAAAPASLGGHVFYQSGTTSTAGFRGYGANAQVLHPDGRYTELYNLSWDIIRATGGWQTPGSGSYLYERTAETTAVLTLLSDSRAPIVLRLSFASDRHGTIQSAPLVDQAFTFWLGVATTPAPLTNVALRAAASSSAPAIAGFVITGSNPRAVLVRAVGPGLARFGVASFLSDPTLGSPNVGAPLNSNDNWETGNAGESLRRVEAATGAFPLAAGSADAAIILPALSPGAYTVHATPRNASASGEVLLEVYLLP